jgi:hypothetical protein
MPAQKYNTMTAVQANCTDRNVPNLDEIGTRVDQGDWRA